MDADNVTINQKTYSLHELMLSIQSILAKTYATKQYWIRCEVSRISLHAQSGHCYLELVDKNETSIVAQLKAMIWSDKYSILSEKFEAVTNTPIANGMKLLLSCSVNFHPLHGLSLTIHDIEPSFTLGEMARMKNNSIARLKAEGLFTLNKNRPLPIFPGRIAVISVATSRGYQDFITTIIHYPKRFAIRHTLFEAVLQGDNAVPSLSRALNKILSQKEKYDAIAIIRGGAGDAGLSCYDEYSIASLMARSPIPIITGIGHATNETVSEMVAYKNCITPTAAANFLLDKFDTLLNHLDENTQRLIDAVSRSTQDQKDRVHHSAERIGIFVRNKIEFQKFNIRHFQNQLPLNTTRLFRQSQVKFEQYLNIILNIKRYGTYQLATSQLQANIISLQTHSRLTLKSKTEINNRLEAKLSLVRNQITNHQSVLSHLRDKINLLDPVNTLKRGYSITRLNGKALTDPHEAAPGALIESELAGGKIISTINN